jgi:hypothetical protein
MFVVGKCAKTIMMRSVIPSYSQRSVLILPVVRIKIGIKRTILFDMKQAIVSQDGSHAKKIKAFAALEVQDFKALDELIL